MQQIISELLIPTVTAILTATITFFATRKKQGVEIEGGEIENASKVLEMSERITERLEAQLVRSDEVIHSLKETIITLRKEEGVCRDKIKALQADCKKYEDLYKDQLKEVDQLKMDIDSLRILLKERGITHEN